MRGLVVPLTVLMLLLMVLPASSAQFVLRYRSGAPDIEPPTATRPYYIYHYELLVGQDEFSQMIPGQTVVQISGLQGGVVTTSRPPYFTRLDTNPADGTVSWRLTGLPPLSPTFSNWPYHFQSFAIYYRPDTVEIPLTWNTTNPPGSGTTVGRGYVGSIGDLVWNDLDGDGAQDAGEPGLDGLTVTLTDSAGHQTTTTTAGGGLYSFTNLAPGTYTVSVAPPFGFTETYDLDGVGTANQTTVSLAAGQVRTDVDFGYQQLFGSIGDTIWYDTDANGIQNGSETGLSDVLVSLYQGSTLVTSLYTDAFGHYLFSGLPAGTYTVAIGADSITGLRQTWDYDDGTGPFGSANAATYTLAPGAHFADSQGNATGLDFGYVQQKAGDAWSSIDSNFDGTAIPAGRWLWFNAHVKVSGATAGTWVRLSNSVITFTVGSTDYSLVPVSSLINFSASATSITSSFTGTELVLTVPVSYDGNILVSGLPYPVATDLPGGINPVTWTGRFTTNNPAVTCKWQWSAAVYTAFSGDWTALGVKPADSDCLPDNADKAGTPENYKDYVVGGARGGGGSNWTGSWSGTGNVTPVDP